MEEPMARFVNGQVPEVVQPFWAALQRGDFIADAAVAVGTYRRQGTRWVAACVRVVAVISGAVACRLPSARRSRSRTRVGRSSARRPAARTVALDDLARAAAQRRS